MRKKIMSGNWKMNLNLAQTTELAEGIKRVSALNKQI